MMLSKPAKLKVTQNIEHYRVVTQACNNNQVALVVSFKAKSETESSDENIMHKLTAQSATESGTLFYAPYFDKTSNTYYLLERYADKAAQKVHVEMEEFNTVFPESLKLISESNKVTVLSPGCKR